MSDPNAVKLFWSITRGQFTKLDGFDEVKNRFKFFTRGVMTWPWTIKWLETITRYPELLEYLKHAPRISSKLHRPYLARSFNMSKRADVLQEHYTFIINNIKDPAKTELLTQGKLAISTIHGKDDASYTLRLTHQHHFDKEGELSLQLRDGNDIALATLTFSIAKHNGEIVAIIGGLQGPRKRHGHECINIATKACHGLFPKRLAVEALTAMMTVLGCNTVLAVCKEHHIYNSWRYNKDFQADYDQFWESIGAEKIDECFFKLPTPIHRKSMEEIASKKRAEYKRRYTLMDDMNLQISAYFNQ